MGGAVSEVDGVGGELGGGGDAVALEEGRVDKITITAGVDEEVGGATLELASEDEEVGSGGVEVEVDGGSGGWGVGRQWRRPEMRRQLSRRCRCWW